MNITLIQDLISQSVNICQMKWHAKHSITDQTKMLVSPKILKSHFLYNISVPNLWPVDHMQPSGPIIIALHQTYKISSLLFDVEYKQVPLQL